MIQKSTPASSANQPHAASAPVYAIFEMISFHCSDLLWYFEMFSFHCSDVSSAPVMLF